MKKRVIAASVALLVAAPALAGTMESTFANSTTITNTKTGAVSTWLFNGDNTYTMKSADGETSGTWSIEGHSICTQPSAPDAPAYCAGLVEGKNPGDTWETTDQNGDTLSISITEGR
ncbi:MAG: hypothetical protein GC199_04440 [Alphaproteobacteria bacterium]|nr:hypothetical protein [Alphaproteobacteria bacterium]